METRRFPPPWTVTEYSGTCFIVKDAHGQKLGTFFFRADPNTAACGANILSCGV